MLHWLVHFVDRLDPKSIPLKRHRRVKGRFNHHTISNARHLSSNDTRLKEHVFIDESIAETEQSLVYNAE